MKTIKLTGIHRLLPSLCLLASAVLTTGSAFAAEPASRISSAITNAQRTRLPESPLIAQRAAFETGRMPADTRIEGVSLSFSRSAAQQAALDALIAAQQNPSSPQFHQWLTPEQFASRFGLSTADIAKVQSWLEQQGFTVDSVNRSHTGIRFSGTVRQVESAFETELYNYTINGEKHFAPGAALSVPTALAPVVVGIRNLDDFKPHSHIIPARNRALRPSFTSSESGNVFFAPGDIKTVYDIPTTLAATGQAITIIGQSAIANSDIEAFQNAAGIPVKDPTAYLVPGTGAITTRADGDETESDLDLEWSGAIATGATINFVYTGSDTNYGVFDSLVYAVDNKIGTIISSSYGACEPELDSATQSTLEAALQQATSQGQTVLSAAGDDGATDCYGYSNLSTTVQEELAVDYPASSTYVIGVGGTEIDQSNASYSTAGDGYWEAEGSTDEITSALQYIPEQVWNEDYSNCGQSDCLGSGGGGASTLFAKPSWQTGVPGIPSANHRYVPDVALYAGAATPGYLFCTSDETDWSSGQVSSCTSGFRDSSTGDLTFAGGTSFAAPIFAGMLALINQAQGYTTGQGIANTEIYKLASNSTTYASAFHDITVGNNKCLATNDCSAQIGFDAAVGYDEASGLGSVDLANLLGAWPAATTSLIATTTTLSASSTTPALNANDTFTVTVTSATGTTVPSGTVNFSVDGGTAVAETLASDGTATYTTAFTTAGSHSVVASYAGDTTHATSSGTVTVTVAGSSSGSGTFALAATNLTVSQGTSGSSTITVTPKSGYTGTVDLTFDTSNDSALANLCYEFTNTNTAGDGTVAVTSSAAVTTQLTLDTNASDCISTDVSKRTGKHSFRTLHSARTAKANNNPPASKGAKTTEAALAFAGLLFAGFLGRYSRKFRALAVVILFASVGLGMSACGGGSSSNSNTPSDPAKGSYTITVTGQDSSSATIPTETTTFTFVID